MTRELETDVSATTQVKQRFGTKAKAILAGGLVLGVGAAITLAAWTDTEWAKSTFGSGAFGIEGSVDGGTNYDDHATEPNAAPLSFSVPAQKLSPNDTVYAGFAVRLISTSTNQANVAVTQNDASKIPNTTATYKYTTSATCDAAEYDAGTSTNENGASFALTSPSTPVYLCFKVAAASNLAQGQTGSISWTFTATSTSAEVTP